jgi:hypothetical protein
MFVASDPAVEESSQFLLDVIGCGGSSRHQWRHWHRLGRFRLSYTKVGRRHSGGPSVQEGSVGVL